MTSTISRPAIPAAALIGQACLELRRQASCEVDPVRFRQLMEQASRLQSLVADVELLEQAR